MEASETKHSGCGQITVAVALLLWLGMVPAGVMFVLDSLLGQMAAPSVAAAIVIVITGALLLLPFGGVLLLTRRRTGWEATGAVSGGLVIVTGYLLLDAVVRAASPASSTPALYSATFARPWGVALTTIGLFVMVTFGGVIPIADWGALWDGVVLWPHSNWHET